MKASEFRQIAKTMREFGITRAKIGDAELEMGGYIGNGAAAQPERARVARDDAPAEESNPIEHKVEQMASLMKLSDVELVDELFPDQTTEPEEEIA